MVTSCQSYEQHLDLFMLFADHFVLLVVIVVVGGGRESGHLLNVDTYLNPDALTHTLVKRLC